MDNILFKQSFRGFDRNEVLSYIDELTGQMNSRADSFANTQRELEEKIEELSRSLEKSESCLLVCNEKGRELAEQVGELKKDNEELKKRIEEYKGIIFNNEKELTILRAEFDKVSRDNEMLSKDNRHWKSRQDDIAEVMVEAQNRARKIIDDANLRARQTKAQLDENAARLAGKVSDVRSEIARIEAQLESSFNTLSDAMKKMEHAGSVIEGQVRGYREEISKVDDFITRAENEAKEKAAEEEYKKTLTDNVLDTITRLLDK
ncbi:MAG: hypothetical protein IJG64_04860 [Oscillospiraceae bacterium]|nr:hypothetical protein [Oscillospiraceae bacterium]